jgi:hypothetical protein
MVSISRLTMAGWSVLRAASIASVASSETSREGTMGTNEIAPAWSVRGVR